MKKANDYIVHLNLQPHPEGGFYGETYRNKNEIQFPNFNGKRSYATSIYFLLLRGQTSAKHRIKSDEIWYFHDGQSLEILEWNKEGKVHITRLGNDVSRGEVLQHVVPANTWFGARLPEESDYCLVGCAVSPGFDFTDFELAQ
jgi:predicted cupin superfamily sugar epimerase